MAGDWQNPWEPDTPIASPNTAGDDPLRSWFNQLNDPGMAALMITDPDKAKELMVQKGIEPPPHASAFTDPSSGLNVPGDDPFAPVRTNQDGTLAGNLTSPSNPDAVPLPAPRPQIDAPATVGSAAPLDPEAPTTPAPTEANTTKASGNLQADTNTDVSARKKGDVAGGVSDFAKSLQGVKALQPPALNPVGTPSVRSPGAVPAPNIASLLQLAGQNQQAHTLASLGKLLVAGKA